MGIDTSESRPKRDHVYVGGKEDSWYVGLAVGGRGGGIGPDVGRVYNGWKVRRYAEKWGRGWAKAHNFEFLEATE